MAVAAFRPRRTRPRPRRGAARAVLGSISRGGGEPVLDGRLEEGHGFHFTMQSVPLNPETISQYDAFGTFARAITPNGLPSTHLKWEPTAPQIPPPRAASLHQFHSRVRVPRAGLE